MKFLPAGGALRNPEAKEASVRPVAWGREMRKTKIYEQAASGTGDGETLKDLESVDGYDRFCLETLAGSIKVLPSIDGSNFAMPQLVMSQEPAVVADAPSTQEGTLVAKTTAGTPAYFTGDFRALRLVQVGATPAAYRILMGGEL